MDVVQTHASYVFLAGPIVYKVKKPVNFGFLDFSTLARRRRFCRREVELNRRLAPDVYLDVVPIRRAGRSFTLDGTGARRRVRRPHASVAGSRLCVAAACDVEPSGRARSIVSPPALRASIARSGPPRGDPLPDRQRLSIDDNLRLIRRHVATRATRIAAAALTAYTSAFYASHAALLARRRSKRRVLDCHGDLRLEHVHIEGSTVRIYDCIEFNDRLRTIDVANDVAFLAMDLDYEGRPELARRLVRTVVRATGDREMVQLIDFYKCYRAAVRNKVESLRAGEVEVRAAERAASAARAARFLELALRYATLGSVPTVVAVMGEVACGKSTLAAGVAEALGLAVASSDITRKRLARLPLHRRPSDKRRQSLYAEGMSRRVYAALLAEAHREARAGRSIVLDATFARRADRDRLRALGQRIGANVMFIEVVTPAALRRRRLIARARGRGAVSDARLADFAALAARYEPLTEIATGSLIRARSRRTAADTLASTLRSLAQQRGRSRDQSSTQPNERL